MEIIHLTKENFEAEALRSAQPVLVDFSAPWCGPCQALGPVLEEAAREQDVTKVAKVNVDEEAELARSYRILSIPTLLLFKNGEVVRREVGGKSKDELLVLLRQG